ncbi:MAG: hypothetical protein LBR26_03780 [Prevotella sp.]|jgi:hypothetical protein|nr:hypothetical protein [Prevotella sp.]
MIYIRACTAFANLPVPRYKRAGDEVGTLVKNIINQTIYLFSDYQNQSTHHNTLSLG